MAEAAIESTGTGAPSETNVTVEMEVENLVSIEETNGAEGQAEKANGGMKRVREEEGEGEESNLKKAKAERSVEEQRLDKIEEEEIEEAHAEERDEEVEEGEGEEKGKKEEIKEVKLGPKVFTSSEDMFDYFYKLLHNWGPNIDINQYEQMVLIDLLKKGHSEPERKIGKGVEAFEVRFHPVYKSRCFFVRRIDGSADDFSFRKCVDAIMPLPDQLKIKPSGGGRSNGGGRFNGGRGGGGRGWRGGRGGRRGRGRGRG